MIHDKGGRLFYEIFSGYTLPYHCQWACVQHDHGDGGGGCGEGAEGTCSDGACT